MSSSTNARVPLPLLIGTGAVIFLANAGLLVLQLVGGRFLAPFIGSSVETWTSVIGVFLTGIALGNWFGGRMADRFPSPKTVAVLLLLSGLSALGMIGCYEFTLSSSFSTSIPLALRIPVLALFFCLPPALFMSLLTPVTIKLLLPDVGSAGRVAGMIFSLSTLGCLIGNYCTGFWLMADFTLNAITSGVGFGLIGLSVPVLFFRRREQAESAPAGQQLEAVRSDGKNQDDVWGFRKNIHFAYAVVFVASFCGMSLELAGVRVLAPILGVSLYTWTGVIGVMLAGTASGNWLGGILADRGVSPALRRFALLLGALIGSAAAPAIAHHYFPGFNPANKAVAEAGIRLLGSFCGILIVVPGMFLCKLRLGGYFTTAAFGGLLGAAFAFSIGRALDMLISIHPFETLANAPYGHVMVHGIGFFCGAIIALMFVWDAPPPGKPVSRSSALSGSLFLGGLMTLAVLMLCGVFNHSAFMIGIEDIQRKVLAFTFGLFFLPMLFLGTISPQVIRLSVPDMQHAGRVAGSIYAWSTAGAIAGTFATGYFLIGMIGTFRVLMILAFILTLLGFLIGKLWKNNVMLYGCSVICGGAIFGLYAIDYGPFKYTKETKYYAIKVEADEDDEEQMILQLDHLIHSSVKINDPTWLYYKHEYVQAELVLLARSRSKETNLLVIGGGGYTFPRYVETQIPDVNVEVVEIDPGVTQVAYQYLGLPSSTRIRTYNMDGRQFISERAAKGHYQLIVQDAVNDLSVPYHLLTREYNEAVKATLAEDGAYLLTLIEPLPNGKLWRAAFRTLRQSFPYVYLLAADDFLVWQRIPGSKDEYEYVVNPKRQIYVIYASNKELDLTALDKAVEADRRAKVSPLESLAPLAPPHSHTLLAIGAWVVRQPVRTHQLDAETLEKLLERQDVKEQMILTDQYCPVDNLMAEVFRNRKKK